MRESEPKRRGRPREYDPESALERARDTFWKGGYAATSLDDLSRAMEMNRPSLYAAFGDKQALYLRALEGYTDASLKALETVLAAPISLRQCLQAVYAGVITFYLQGKGPARGCFLLSTALTEAASQARVRQLLQRTFHGFDEAFTRRMKKAAGDGELKGDVQALAPLATAVVHSIALRARAGAARSELEQLAAGGVALLTGA